MINLYSYITRVIGKLGGVYNPNNQATLVFRLVNVGLNTR